MDLRWVTFPVVVGLLNLVACGDSASSGGQSSSGGAGAGGANAGGSSNSGGDAQGGSGGIAGSGGSAQGGGGAGGAASSAQCTLYCSEFLTNCTAIADVELYTDESDCLTTCAGFEHGPEGAFSGNTVECRVAHLTFKPNPGPGYYELHCFHAQEHPTAQCL